MDSSTLPGAPPPVSYAAEMLRHFDNADSILKGTHPEMHQNIYRPPVSGRRDWRLEMGRVDAIAGELLEQLGYERGATRAAASAAAGGQMYEVARRISRSAHRTRGVVRRWRRRLIAT